MRVVETIAEMHEIRDGLKSPVAMVATLGGIHRGHEALLASARNLGRTLVTSLFLNPTQFGDPADLENYPRDLDRDLGIFREHRVDVVFKPSVDEMYPPGATTSVDPGPIAELLEGKFRPGHFTGVATVVTKILTVIRPNIAVWGAKDAQQNVVIGRMTLDLGMNVRHVIESTVRDSDGLALSTRNAHLDTAHRRAALVLPRSLSRVQAEWSGGERGAEVLRSLVRECLDSEPLASLEYISIVDPGTLTELTVAPSGTLVLLGVAVGASSEKSTRLIDNVVLGEKPIITERV